MFTSWALVAVIALGSVQRMKMPLFVV